MDALPFCQATLHTIRCPIGPYFYLVKGYPEHPKTVGDAIRKRRLDLGLQQAEVAKVIGCDPMTVVNWEKGHTTPRIHLMAKVVRFLGYDPLPKGTTLGEKIAHFRRSQGITQTAFAEKLGVDPGTLSRWETGEREPRGAYFEALNLYLTSLSKSPTPQAFD